MNKTKIDCIDLLEKVNLLINPVLEVSKKHIDSTPDTYGYVNFTNDNYQISVEVGHVSTQLKLGLFNTGTSMDMDSSSIDIILTRLETPSELPPAISCGHYHIWSRTDDIIKDYVKLSFGNEDPAFNLVVQHETIDNVLEFDLTQEEYFQQSLIHSLQPYEYYVVLRDIYNKIKEQLTVHSNMYVAKIVISHNKINDQLFNDIYEKSWTIIPALYKL